MSRAKGHYMRMMQLLSLAVNKSSQTAGNLLKRLNQAVLAVLLTPTCSSFHQQPP
jgi:hypothetical protein